VEINLILCIQYIIHPLRVIFMPKLVRYVSYFCGLIFAAIIVYYIISSTELSFPGSSRLRSALFAQPSDEPRSSGVSPTQRELIQMFPEHLQMYAMYDLTAKSALVDLKDWLYDNKVELPLFQNKLEHPTDSKPTKVCLFAATARRTKSPFSYIIQAISALLNRMDYVKHKEDVYIHVFNVDANPDKHRDVEKIRNLVPVTNIKAPYHIPHIPRKYQENLDFALILRKISTLNCLYPIIIEDDGLPAEHWVDQVFRAIDQLEERQGNLSNATNFPTLTHRLPKPWLAMKLYCAREKPPKTPPTGLSDYFQRWNSVAITLNSSMLIEIAQQLEKNVYEAKFDFSRPIAKDDDIAIYVEKKGYAGYCYEPVVFQHTGVYSSVVDRQTDKGAINYWYMKSHYFESEGKPIVFDETMWKEF
jgi:hypothetical protein